MKELGILHMVEVTFFGEWRKGEQPIGCKKLYTGQGKLCMGHGKLHMVRGRPSTGQEFGRVHMGQGKSSMEYDKLCIGHRRPSIGKDIAGSIRVWGQSRWGACIVDTTRGKGDPPRARVQQLPYGELL